MKTLVTCTPREFIAQTLRIKELAESWLKDTKILEIRKQMPEFKKATAGMSDEELRELRAYNTNLLKEQSNKNLSQIMTAALEKEPDKTLALMALCCFVEPEEVNNNPMGYYLEAFAELMGDKSVINFFISLVQLGQITTSDASKESTKNS